MLRRLRIPLVTALLSLTGFTSIAAPPRPDCSRTLTLGLHEHGLLYSSETNSGIDKDISDEMIRRSGCTIVVSLMPRARIWQLIESGALDFSLSGITNDNRDRFASFAWYFTNKYYLLVRDDAGVHHLPDFERDEHLRLGAIRGFRYSETANRLVDSLQEDHRVVFATTLPPLYDALLNGQIQAMIVEPFDYPVLQQDRIRSQTSIMEFGDPSIRHGLIMSKQSISPDEQEKWKDLINDMHQDGTIKRILLKYFSEKIANDMTDY